MQGVVGVGFGFGFGVVVWRVVGVGGQVIRKRGPVPHRMGICQIGRWWSSAGALGGGVSCG